MNAVYARLRFAPLWMAVPKIPRARDAKSPARMTSPAFAMVRQPEWQKRIGLSSDQKKSLLAIDARAATNAQRRAEQFKSLPLEEQTLQVKALGSPTPWRPQWENEVRKQVEAVLTPRQLQTLEDSSFPEDAIDLLYDAHVRQRIGFGAEQEDRLRRLARERLALFQRENLKRADKVWGLLNPRQQAKLPEVVRHQGPTSAVLSIAGELGFDLDALGLSYPMIAELPVRERLGLSAEQEKKVQAVMADVAARSQKVLHGGAAEADDADRRRFEDILTPQQLTALKEIDFRRAVVLALGYPEKRKTLGITEQQTAELGRLDTETYERLHRVDREMLGKALEILTPRQWDRLIAEMDRAAQE
jgi:hypothetical protein